MPLQLLGELKSDRVNEKSIQELYISNLLALPST
jgi:hypothetical protein